MGLNIKAEFIEYLKSKNEEDNSFLEKRGLDVDNLNNVSIFMFSQEFKDFLQDEYNGSQNILSLNISDIDDLELKNGKIVNKKEEQEKEKEEGNEGEKENNNIAQINQKEAIEVLNLEEGEDQSTTDVPETENIDDAITDDIDTAENTQIDNTNSEKETITYTDVLNAMFEDEEFLKEFDTDKDGIIGEEEFLAFQEKIKGLDGEEENLSMEDIIAKAKETTANTELDTEEITQIEETEAPTETESVGGTYGGGGGGSYNYNPTSNQPRGLDSMTVEELQTELATAQDDLSKKQETLANISNGTDPQIAALKENMDTSLENYNKALNDTNNKDAKKLALVNTQIAEKEQAIKDKDTEIFNQQATVQEKTEAYEVASANLEDLQSKQQILLTTDTSEMSEKQKQRIEERKAAVEAAISQAEADKQTALDNKEEAESKLETLEQEKNELEEQEPTLEYLEEQRSELEGNLSDLLSEEPLKDLKDIYEKAKTTYETESASALSKAQDEVTAASEQITKVNNALTKAQERENERDYSPIDIGESIIEFAKQFLGASEANNLADKFVQQYGGYDSSSTPWCAAFVEYVLRNSGEYDSIPEWYKTANGSYDAPKWGCGAVLNSAPQGARVDVNSAKPGDLILFNWSGSSGGGADHIGFVVGIEDGKLITIEGNTSNQVAYRSYDLNSPYIRAILDITYTG